VAAGRVVVVVGAGVSVAGSGRAAVASWPGLLEHGIAAVERVCAAMGIGPHQAIVMGDGANDLKMMAVAGLSVAFRAKPVVYQQAGVALNFSGLDGLLNILAE
jgi:3-deoxy-D-manno-octulosonate 8-phosphate phosphatase KdsC-like HAD superfamily phosphatase